MLVSKIPYDIEKEPEEWAEFVQEHISDFVDGFLTHPDNSRETREAFKLKIDALMDIMLDVTMANIWAGTHKPPAAILALWLEKNKLFHQKVHKMCLADDG